MNRVACLALVAHVACSQDVEPSPGGRADGGVDAGATSGTVSAEVVDWRGAPVADRVVVFHDPEGHPVAQVKTSADGLASATVHAGGGVTLVESLPGGSNLVSAIDLPVGATVRLRSLEQGSIAETTFQVNPVLPAFPVDASGFVAGYIWIPCDDGPDQRGQVTATGLAGIVAGDARCLETDGTYSVVGVLRYAGKTYLLQRRGIPASDVAPVMPPWQEATTETLQRVMPLGAAWHLADVTPARRGEAQLIDVRRRGDQLTLRNPLQGDELIVNAASVQSWVRFHELPPHTVTKNLDLEAQRTRSPKNVQIAASGSSPAVSWDEIGPGRPARFLVARFDWEVDGATTNSTGSWSVVAPSRAGAITFPTLPSELASFVEPGDRGATWSETATVTFVDDSGAPSYADFVAVDPLAAIEGRPTRGPRIERGASATARRDADPAKGPGRITLTSDPPAVDGLVTVAPGATVSFTMHSDDAANQVDSWTLDPSDYDFSGNVTASIPGLILGVTAANGLGASDTLFVQTTKPACVETLAPIRPEDPDGIIEETSKLALAARRDGTPVVAFMSFEFVSGTAAVAASVVAWDGTTWAHVAPDRPLASVSDPVFLFLVLDANDVPFVAYMPDRDTFEIWKASGDGWTAATAPLTIPGLVDPQFLLDDAGDPVVAGIRHGPGELPTLWVYRWKGGTWQGRLAYTQESFEGFFSLGSLAMDGDRPVVAFVAASNGNPVALTRVARLDAEVVDLGPIEDDETSGGDSRPILFVPSVEQPAVAYIGHTGTEVDSPAVVRTAQRDARGWSPYGVSLPLELSLLPISLVWDPASHRAFAVVQESFSSASELRAIDDGSLVCTPLFDPEVPAYHLPFSLAGPSVVVDPMGGYLIGGTIEGVQFYPDALLVQKVSP